MFSRVFCMLCMLTCGNQWHCRSIHSEKNSFITLKQSKPGLYAEWCKLKIFSVVLWELYKRVSFSANNSYPVRSNLNKKSFPFEANFDNFWPANQTPRLNYFCEAMLHSSQSLIQVHVWILEPDTMVVLEMYQIFTCTYHGKKLILHLLW